MFPRVHFECSLRSETPHARSMQTNELLDSSVGHQEVIDHLLVMSAVDAALRTARFAFVHLHVLQQVQSVIV